MTDAEAVFGMLLISGAAPALQQLNRDEAVELFESWTPEQREAAEQYFGSIIDGSMAAEYGEEHPCVICPEFLKSYGCYDHAAIVAEGE
jgi:hypothetical protein